MKRIRLFEFEDLPWFPETIRSGGTDYLRYFLSLTNFYRPVVPVLAEAMEKAGTEKILDLCSGGGGPILQIQKNLKHYSGKTVRVTVSDKFPNLEAFRFLEKEGRGDISYIAEPVDALEVPPEIDGFRTLFSGFHHFDKDAGRLLLQDAVRSGKGIGIFDGGDKNLMTALGILLFHPIGFLVFTPFIRPFRLSRLFFTYILPVIPLYTIWDGIVSISRLYSPEQLLQITGQIDHPTYKWTSGSVRNRLGMRVNYLIGIPFQTG